MVPNGNNDFYIIQSIDNNVIKIGCTGSINARINDIKNKEKTTYRILFVFNGSKVDMEKFFKLRLKAFKLRGSEWFKPESLTIINPLIEKLNSLKTNRKRDNFCRKALKTSGINL